MPTSAPAPTDVRDTLRELRGADFAYFMGTGNAGDALINVAAMQLFSTLGLRPRFLNYRSAGVPEGGVLVCSGGGNFVSMYHNLANFVRKHHRSAKRLIVLPHSYSGHEALLRELGPNVLLMCREPRSFDYLNGLGLRAEVELSEDVALNLDPATVLRGQPLAPEDRGSVWRREAWRDRLKYAVRSAAYLRTSPRDPETGRRSLLAYRDDAERTEAPLPSNNCDASVVFSSRDGYYLPDSALRSTRALLGFLNHFDDIFTNRLHVAIAALLLGKDVHIAPNNYHKLESIYRFSLKHRFPKAHWEAADDARPD
ncbi:polysaccharide pyruvyl transferase family protein [Tautonia sp. JC769]|uniref:polysaccharide pyruvyl transferase family protein n=1 Tax=Tautonia sp. JC769 TaxID=3232135 RepID=UPI003459C83D